MTYDNFAEAARHFADQVHSIAADAWDGPGLGEWDLRALVGHTSRSLVTVESYLAQPADAEEVATPAQYYALVAAAASGPAVAERGREAGRAMGDDPAGYVDALIERVLPLAAAAGDPLIRTFAIIRIEKAQLPHRLSRRIRVVKQQTRTNSWKRPILGPLMIAPTDDGYGLGSWVLATREVLRTRWMLIGRHRLEALPGWSWDARGARPLGRRLLSSENSFPTTGT